MTEVSTKQFRRKVVRGGRKGKRRMGKVKYALFHPASAKVVGFVIKRGDFLLMFKRKDRFLALGSFCLEDGELKVSADAKDAWDGAAFKRLGVDPEQCIVWENMDLMTTDGVELGYVGEVAFDAATGKVAKVSCADGIASKKLLGATEIPVSMIKGYEHGHILLQAEAASLEEGGGWAAKAGAASAKLQHKAATKKKEAGEKVGAAAEKGAYKTGEAIGKARQAMNDKYDEIADRNQEETAAYKLGTFLGKARDMFAADDDDDFDDDEDRDAAEDEEDEGLGWGGMFSSFADEFKKSLNDD